jgi:Fe-S oxidoreductase
VILWADSFSEHLEPAVADAAVRVLHAAGFAVYLAPASACCGLTWLTTGQLGAARAHLRGLLDQLAPFALCGVPIVGLEPSCTAVLRHELPDLFPGDRRAAAVAAATVTLAELLTRGSPSAWRPPDLTGTSLIVQPHCHHHAVMGFDADLTLLHETGAQVTVLSGCCGMAGDFGMEARHRELSQAVAGRALLPAIEAAPAGAIVLADGFSCRTQVADLQGRRSWHLAQLLAGDAR